MTLLLSLFLSIGTWLGVSQPQQKHGVHQQQEGAPMPCDPVPPQGCPHGSGQGFGGGGGGGF